VHADQAHARTTITGILGPHGLADKSLRPCPAGEVLGWHVDIPRLTILPSAKGCRKLLWTFFTLDVTAKKWPLRQCQLLASLAQRYHVALQGMAPYVYPFEALLTGSTQGPPHRHLRRSPRLHRRSRESRQTTHRPASSREHLRRHDSSVKQPR
jgi:hypothetical protein